MEKRYRLIKKKGSVVLSFILEIGFCEEEKPWKLV